MLILGILIWILIALIPARIAASKGRSFFMWFLISIPFWWVSLFITLSMKPEGAAKSVPPTTPPQA
jgi:hypothetical protein